LAILASRRVTRSTMSAISRRSSALLVRAGIKMMILSPSRYADTVRRRRVLRRTSMGGDRSTMSSP
jgi:hypothetical protein